MNIEEINASAVHMNQSPAWLVQRAIERGEGVLTDRGALAVNTGKYTGRSPDDKFLVDSPAVHDRIHWGRVNRPISREVFEKIKAGIIEYLSGKEIFVFEGFAGADRKYAKKFRVVNECAWQNLFISNLLIHPTDDELRDFGDADYTILAAPGFKCDAEALGIHSEAAVIIDYEARYAVIAGTAYAGEIKKTVFSIMNYVLPVEHDILPMHCSANMDPETGETAIFFGLSGTGKTTFSAVPDRVLIGDDEHGWSADGVFNIEGGCYAKCIRLNHDEQPEIYDAVRFGAVTENLVLDPYSHKPDYYDDTITANTRAGYPIDFIPNASKDGKGRIPNAILMLTADAFGVLPPIARLSRGAAMYQFITGFTAKLEGTERGVKEPVPTFSALFGEPFMPLRAEEYAKMLGEKMDKYGTSVYLVNTGWVCGQYGVGHRISLKMNRDTIAAALDGSLENVEYVHNALFNIDVPLTCPGVDPFTLDPRNLWEDKEAYDAQAVALAGMFEKNFREKYPDMDPAIAAAGPHASAVTERG